MLKFLHCMICYKGSIDVVKNEYTEADWNELAWRDYQVSCLYDRTHNRMVHCDDNIHFDVNTYYDSYIQCVKDLVNEAYAIEKAIIFLDRDDCYDINGSVTRALKEKNYYFIREDN